jgi:hypothetical protein
MRRLDRLEARLDSPNASDRAIERLVRDLCAELERAGREPNEYLRGSHSGRIVELLGRAARRSDAALRPLADALASSVTWDAGGGYDPWWESVAEHACMALGQLGARAVPLLIEKLAHPSAGCREQAARALSRIGASAHPAIPTLEGLAHDASESVQIAAGAALGSIRPKDASARLEVERLLATPETRLAGFAASYSLPSEERARLVGQFTSLLRDEDPGIREHALRQLGSLGSSADCAALALIACITDPFPNVSTAALDALETVAVSDASVARSLLAVARGDDRRLRYRALLALSKRPSPVLLPFVSELLAAMRAEGDEMRDEWAQVMGALGPAAPLDVVELLVERLVALPEDDERPHHLLVDALGEIGPTAKGSLPALGRLEAHPNPRVRARVAATIELIRAGARPHQTDER